MNTPLAGAAPLALAVLGLLPAAAPAQISLDLAGGLVGENLTCTAAGPVAPTDLLLLTFSDTTGPLPMSLFFPGDPSFLDQDLSFAAYPGFVHPSTYVNPIADIDLSSISPTLVGAKVFGQAWTTGLGNPFVTSKSNVITVILGAHGVSTPTHGAPLFPQSYAITAPLPGGNLLLAGGGAGLGSAGEGVAQIYDYRSSTFVTPLGAPLARAAGVGVALDDGRVLLTGGIDINGVVTNSCQLYNPVTKTFASTGSMATPRVLHTLVKLSDGRVLACGGSTAVSGADPVAQLLSFVSNATGTAEIYNPTTGLWSATTNLPSVRTGHTAALLPDGRVLVAGGVQPGFLGIPSFLTSATRYNPTTAAWNATASMGGTGRAISSVATLADGRVLVAGGVNANVLTLSATAVPDVSIYNNTTNTWQNGPNLAAGRYSHGLVRGENGRIYALGGVVGTVSSTTTPLTTAACEQYNPATNTWSAATPLLEPRAAAGIGFTPDGKRVVVSGGSNDLGPITPATAELYVP